MPDPELSADELRAAVVHLALYCKELMTEHIAMDHTMREQRTQWRQTYMSYLQQASIATDAAFRELEQAIADETNLRPALERFLRLYPVKTQ
jgi:hypothetical protein